MKELLAAYAQYNIWANKLLIDVILKLEDGVADKEVASSFPSLRTTVSHMWSAESIWLQRLSSVESPVWIGNDHRGDFGAACHSWQQVSAGLLEFVEQRLGDGALQNTLEYTDRANRPHKRPVYEVLHHVFNHSAYHRGQLVTMLRQLGIKDIPGTDFLGFVMK